MIKKLRVTVDGRPYDVTVEFDDDPLLPLASGVTVGASSPPPPILAGSASIASAPAPLTSATPAPATTAGANDVPSPLAGRVTAISVEAGQQVKEGDHLLTLEAMKMNTLVMAPRAGSIKEVKVTVGSAVEEGQPLMTLVAPA